MLPKWYNNKSQRIQKQGMQDSDSRVIPLHLYCTPFFWVLGVQYTTSCFCIFAS